MNIVAIANACAVECVRQHVGLDRVAMLINAYVHATEIDTLSVGNILSLARMVEPYNNVFGFRWTPVTFADGGSSASASDIPRLMDRLIDEINGGGSINVDAIVKEFLWIHPFKDGNGRLGFILQNFLDGTLNNPKPLVDHFG